MNKVWFLSDSGRKLGKASDEELAECLPQLPDPVQVFVGKTQRKNKVAETNPQSCRNP